MSQLDTFDRILASLHDAMLDDAHWAATSLLIDQACGVKGNALVVGKGRSQEDGQIFLARFCYRGERYEDREQRYFDLYYPWDERVPRVAQLPDSRLVHITDLYTARELKTSPAYNEALPRGGFQHGLNARLDGADGSSIVWTLADSIEPDGWGSTQTRMIERLLPHIRQYVQVRQVVAGAEALGDSLSGLLDNTRLGVIHLDRRGHILEANSRARRLLRKGDGLFDPDGFLRARLPADNARLERLVVDPASRPRVDAGLVAEALGLTPSESQVAALLAAGSSVRDIATATGRQENAVYKHLKQMYRKLGISRQADLVRLVLSRTEF